MDPFLTIYKKDYVPKPIKRNALNRLKQEFKNPLNKGYKKYLHLKSDRLNAPHEEIDAYLERFKEKNPELGTRYFKTHINKPLIERNFAFEGRTVYQVDYCDLAKDLDYAEILRNKNKVTLPEDWDIPLTTQRGSYRDPSLLNKNALVKSAYITYDNNLDPDENMRKIMKVNTGSTEYQSVIGALGDIIIEDELHGKIIHIPCKRDVNR